jgi:hypothetical protein
MKKNKDLKVSNVDDCNRLMKIGLKEYAKALFPKKNKIPLHKKVFGKESMIFDGNADSLNIPSSFCSNCFVDVRWEKNMNYDDLIGMHHQLIAIEKGWAEKIKPSNETTWEISVTQLPKESK